MEQYKNSRIYNELMTLSVSQIEEVKELYKRKYPNEKKFLMECRMAIAEKVAAADKEKEMIDLIKEIKKRPGQCRNTATGQ